MTTKFLLVASFADSVLKFRGALISTLLGQGIVVHVAVPGLSEHPSIREELEGIGAKTHDIPLTRTGTNPVSDLRLLWCLYRLMVRVRPDTVMGYTIKPVIFGSLAAWLAKVPHRYALITGLGFAFTGGRSGLLTRLIHQLYRVALSKTEKVFFQNSDDQSLFHERGILPMLTPSVVVNGSGVDLSEFESKVLPTGVLRFLMIGRLLGDKGVREYANAAQSIKAANPAIQFCLAGWIDENPDAISQAEIDAWTGQGCVEFFGRLEDVRPAVADASVYVLPSYREGTPRTVLEAMAMGRAIITTDAPGCRETVIEGENGFLVPIKSATSLIDAMQKFIDDPQLVQRMGKRSREIAEDKYDVHKVNAVMLREMGIK